jgi:DNA-binding transcriptional MerR regulator
MNQRREQAVKAYKPLFSKIKALLDLGMTLEEVAEELTAQGHHTIDGGPLHKVAIHRILQRFHAETPRRAGPTWRKGLTPREREIVSEELDARIVRLSQRGIKKDQIAHRLSLSIHSVRRRVRRLVVNGRLGEVDERKKERGR